MAITLTQPLQYRFVDPVRGGLRRSVDILPGVTLMFDTQLELVPLAMRGKARRVAVVLPNNSKSPVAGSMTLELPRGWTAAPAESPIAFQHKRERATLICLVTPNEKAAPGRYELRAKAVVRGKVFDQSVRTVACTKASCPQEISRVSTPSS